MGLDENMHVNIDVPLFSACLPIPFINVPDEGVEVHDGGAHVPRAQVVQRGQHLLS